MLPDSVLAVIFLFVTCCIPTKVFDDNLSFPHVLTSQRIVVQLSIEEKGAQMFGEKNTSVVYEASMQMHSEMQQKQPSNI